MSLKSLKDRISNQTLTIAFGEVTKISSTIIIARGLHVSIGDTVTIVSEKDGSSTLGMVTEIDAKQFFISPFSFIEGFRVGDKVYLNQGGMSIPVGNALLV